MGFQLAKITVDLVHQRAAVAILDLAPGPAIHGAEEGGIGFQHIQPAGRQSELQGCSDQQTCLLDRLHFGKGSHHRRQQMRLLAPGASAEEVLDDILAGAVTVIGGASAEPGLGKAGMDAAMACRVEIGASLAGLLVEGEMR